LTVRVPLSWLRDYTAVPGPVEDLAERMTMHGLPVERILRPWAGLSGIRVARVVEVTDHPQAHRLVRAVVDDGSGQREVVVGVRNMVAGDLVPYAPPGATLPTLEEPLERREIRGLASEGMLCSPKELGISADHSAILVLDDELEVGADLTDALGLDEAVLDLEVMANRADLLSIFGVAREVAAMSGEDLVPPDPSVSESLERAASAASVQVADPERCPRYVARVIREVGVGPAPLQAQVRLSAAGMRPVSNVVDATNYVMVELGQPLHPFDLRHIAGPGIVVRRAEAGERLTTLDGVDRNLTDEDLLITDVERAVALAGLIGGGETEVSGQTDDVLLEAAHFEPRGIFRTSRRLGLRTEASIRFERGIDPESVEAAAARAAALIVAWSGGRVLSGVVDAGSIPSRRTVSIRPERASMLLGVSLTASEVRESLGRLRIPAADEEGRVTAEVPGHRVDLEREVDLIEEVGRVTGYDRVPSSLPGVRQAGGLTAGQRIRREARNLLAGAGLFETLSYSFVPANDAALFDPEGPVRVANPISDEDAFLRTSLLPGLLRAAGRSVALGRTSVRLFEVGAVFAAADPQPKEEERLAVLLTGPVAEGWPAQDRRQDFADVKGVLEHLMAGLRVEGWALGESPGSQWHAGRSATVLVAGELAGRIGELSRAVTERYDLPGRVAALEVSTASLVAAGGRPPTARDLSRFPPVRRDVAFVLDRDVSAGEVHQALAEAGGDLLDRAVLFDVFEGDPLPPGKKSLAFALDVRAADRTLTDQEADEVVQAIAERIRADFGGELRAG
jgi:phenylalanyl-tRNA synthetase beta chain